ncbi:diaminopimelate decarboxylase [Mycobacterium sherrisii]|uniref:Diaminopimelate decarboxylase n=1 Tax=Mycobacterium sherrisii TaxID=243061 RepID=A0A1E3SYL5_9MYCO|nr:diaminopimelate decarboxylase [Mycobacterium sherrisii]
MTLFELLPSLRHGLNPHLDRAIWPLSSYIDDLGRLCLGGMPVTEIAAEFGTPAYVLDEEDFRTRLRCYRAALPGIELVYAGKALVSTAVAGWAAAEGAGLAVCSPGELATALTAGVPPSQIVVHGNAKTADELHVAVGSGVGRIVIDSPNEIALLAARVRRRQDVLIRVIPDVDGQAGAAFGFTLADGRAASAIKRVLNQPWLNLVGLHCHLGGQIADPAPYGTAIRQLVALMADVRDRYGAVLGQLNLGGGHEIPYVSGDPELSPRALAAVIESAVSCACTEFNYPRPQLVIEPGRAIAGRAGLTLYRIVSVKRQPGGPTLVIVDGGLPDNPHETLRRVKHTVALANRHVPTKTTPATIMGRHGECGEEIARDVALPTDVHPGDLLAMACTGAYHHSMGSTCNMVGRPPLIAVADRQARVLVRRETVADLLSRDCDWSHQRRGGRPGTMDTGRASGE